MLVGPPSGITRPDSRPAAAVLAGLTVLGLALRLRGIGELGFWYDEMALWLYSLTGEPPTPLEPPLMSWLLFAVFWWTRSADAILIHFVPAVLGALAVPLAFRGALLFGSTGTAAWAAAVLMALSPMGVYYSREGRPYALFILVSTGVLLAAHRAYRDDDRRSWWRYALLLFLCGLTHLLTVQVLVALGVTAVVSLCLPRLWGAFPASRFARFAVFSAAGGLAGLAWALERKLASVGSSTALMRAFDGLYPHGPAAFFRTLLVNLGPGPVQAIFGPPTRSDLLALAFLVLFAFGLARLWTTGRRGIVALLLPVFAVSLSVNYLTLGVKGSWDWARYVSHLLLPFLVVCGVGWEEAGSRLRRPAVRAATVLLFVALLLPGSLRLHDREEYRRYEETVLYLADHAGELQGVIVLPARPGGAGGADERITNIYHYHKRERLTVYHLGRGELRRAERVPSRGGLTTVVRDGSEPVGPLAAGAYAVLSRRPLADCGDVGRWAEGARIRARGTARVLAGLTVCDFVAAE